LVVGSARGANHAFLADVGADEAVDYTTVDVGESVRNVDLLLDTVGGGTAGEALPAVRDGGIVVTLSGTSVGPLRELAADRVRVLGILVEPDRAGLEGLAELVTSGELRPHVSKTFQLEDAPRAHELGETGRTQGKLVLTVD
jgi:NADPH:quinone reductase-like Zn-dependent oxidoreductase